MHANTPTRPPAMASVPSPFASKPPALEVPHDPRLLTRSEQRRGDLYIFESPKLGRPIEVIHRGRLAMALELEFDPYVWAWVERPRLLSAKSREIELCFWSRHVSGRERFLLFVDATTTVADPKTRIRQHRQSRDLIEAANLAGMALEFVFEADLLERKSALTTWFRLLPYVQTASALPHVDALERLVVEVFSMQGRMSFLQLEQSLPAHAPPDVRAVACRLIHRGVLHVETSRPITRLSVISKEVRA